MTAKNEQPSIHIQDTTTMTSNDTSNKAGEQRITSRSWVSDYYARNGETRAPPTIAANANVLFVEGGAPEDAVPIPSMDPALRLSPPGSRMSSIEGFRFPSFDHRLASVDFQKSSATFDWLQKIVANSNAPVSSNSSTNRVPSLDLLAYAVASEEEPPLSPERETVVVPPVAKSDGVRKYVTEVRQWDILSERGGKANHHDGNKRYRKVVMEMKAQYQEGKLVKTAKTDLARSILDYIARYGGRFLKKDEKNGRYYEMTRQQARKKLSQALREKKQLKWTEVKGAEDNVNV